MDDNVEVPWLKLHSPQHQEVMISGLEENYRKEHQTDIVLICGEGCEPVKAHTLVLSNCSDYLKKIIDISQNLKYNYPIIPLVVLKDMPHQDVKAIVEFIYTGRMTIPKSQLDSVIKTSKLLEVNGLQNLDKTYKKAPLENTTVENGSTSKENHPAVNSTVQPGSEPLTTITSCNSSDTMEGIEHPKVTKLNGHFQISSPSTITSAFPNKRIFVPKTALKQMESMKFPASLKSVNLSNLLGLKIPTSTDFPGLFRNMSRGKTYSQLSMKPTFEAAASMQPTHNQEVSSNADSRAKCERGFQEKGDNQIKPKENLPQHAAIRVSSSLTPTAPSPTPATSSPQTGPLADTHEKDKVYQLDNVFENSNEPVFESPEIDLAPDDLAKKCVISEISKEKIANITAPSIIYTIPRRQTESELSKLESAPRTSTLHPETSLISKKSLSKERGMCSETVKECDNGNKDGKEEFIQTYSQKGIDKGGTGDDSMENKGALIGDTHFDDLPQEDTTLKHGEHVFDVRCKLCRNSDKKNAKNKDEPKQVRVELNKRTNQILPEATKSPKDVKYGISSSRDLDPDQIPTSTTVVPLSQMLPSQNKSCWKGIIFMQDVAKFAASGHTVSGTIESQDIPDSVQVCGRIPPEQVLAHVKRLNVSSRTEISVVRFSPTAVEDKKAYDSFFAYLNDRRRYGVVGATKSSKDFYILPLPHDVDPPEVLLPFSCTGIGKRNCRPNLLIGILIKYKKASEKHVSSKHRRDRHERTSSNTENAPERQERSHALPPQERSYSASSFANREIHTSMTEREPHGIGEKPSGKRPPSTPKAPPTFEESATKKLKTEKTDDVVILPRPPSNESKANVEFIEIDSD